MGHQPNPQSLNQYAYVYNDPLNWIDPDGLNAAAPGSWSFPCPFSAAWCYQVGASFASASWDGDQVSGGGGISPGAADIQAAATGYVGGVLAAEYGGKNNVQWGTNGWQVFIEAPDEGCTNGVCILTWPPPGMWVNAGGSWDVPVGMDIWHDSPQCPYCAETWRDSSQTANAALIATGAVLVAVPVIGEAAGAVAACQPGLNTSNYGHVTVYCRAWMPGNLIGVGYDPRNGIHVNVGPIHIPLWPW